MRSITVAAVNEKVRTRPGLINTDPYGEGWLVRLRPTEWERDVGSLVTGAAIPAAVETYMALLSETFRQPPP